MEAAVPAEEALVLVEYGFEYRAKDGTLVSIKPNERYVLLKRTNHHWWHVKKSGDTRPFYIPAQYVKELPPIAAPAPKGGVGGGGPCFTLHFTPCDPSCAGLNPRALCTPKATDPLSEGPSAVPNPGAIPVPLPKPNRRQNQPASAAVGLRRPREEPEEPPAPIYLNIQELREEAAATSSAPEEAGSSLSDWETHTDTDSGHLFYYNPVTGETTWDCPFGQAEDGVSPVASPASSLPHSPEFPEWEQYMDEASGQAFFYNSVTGETSWDPPHTGDGGSSQDMYPGVTRYGPMEQRPPTPETDYPDLSPDELEGYPEEDYSPVGSYDQGAALCLSPRRPEELGSPPGWYGHSHPEGAVFCPEHFTSDTVRGWGQEGEHPGEGQPALPQPQHQERQGASLTPPPCFVFQFKSLEKAGVLNRTKTVDRGKRLRKNWSSSWTVLEGGILTFFKDSKHSAAGALRHPSTLTTPEHTVELRGATLAWAGKDKSSKKHVLELKTREGSEFLIQHDSEQIITAWQKAIADSIGRLGTGLPDEEDAESGAEFGSREKLGGSEEKRAAGQPMGSASGESDSSKVRNKLRKFLQRRPTLQSLREKGYIKDQVFGCSLQALCERERGTVPRFVLQCIQTVERRGLDIDGLYRVSGNLATIQKLRYKVEHDEHLDLDDGRWEDIHVVTGALKLFFRELPEPLVPFSHFDKFIAAIKMQDPTRRGRCVRDLVFS
uniref:Rho GTPase activating protein 27 n=1 Tax=Buteo japonicus TaxID=224669 RepID=A0A8C0HNV3_9AVES